MMRHQREGDGGILMEKEHARQLLKKLSDLRAQVAQDGDRLYQRWKPAITRPAFEESALNLAHYLALRRQDLREIQWDLMSLGLSSLGRLEARVMPTIDSVVSSCAGIAGAEGPHYYPSPELIKRGETILADNSEVALGPEPEDRYTRIMVTLPTEAAREPQLIDGLVARGMEIARINCSHDDEEVWGQMIQHVREAAARHGRTCRISMEVPGPKVRIDRVLSSLRKARVFQGDRVLITGAKRMSLPAGIQIALSISMPEIMEHVELGGPVIIDDGHIESVAEEITEEGVILRITKVVKENGVLLRPEKGINFPGNDYRIPLLSQRDEEIMGFICQHADLIGCSFVRDEQDIDLLRTAINQRLPVPDSKPVMLKIETLESMRILPRILVAAASHFPTAVMIARGDLAVEVGYARLSEYQEEILWICEAAHVPVIWATQVVETLVKTGIPTRAEVSDVTLAAKSECIMLNKGPHINDAVSFVADILGKFEKHVYKKTAILRKLSIASEVFEDV